jgi:tetratricopeptide (TPR) repeat protein
MRFKQLITVFVLALVAMLGGCRRDPNVAKKKYVESGNRYFANNKFKEARIMYLDAIQKDQKYGPAYYRLGLTALKIGPVRDAVNAFRRAIELLPPEEADHWDARVRLSEIYLVVAREQKQFLDEVEQNCQKLLKRDPNSFDGHRLTGDLHMARALLAMQTARKDEALSLLKSSVDEYDIAVGAGPFRAGRLCQGRGAVPPDRRKEEGLPCGVFRAVQAVRLPAKASGRRAGAEVGFRKQPEAVRLFDDAGAALLADGPA